MTMISGFTSKTKVETDIVTMTPDWSRELLDRQQFKNRPLRRSTVMRYAREMRDGRWRLTHQGLLIDIDTNEVVDGQHRLQACIQADVPFETVLTFMEGATDMFPDIDQGIKRTPGDTLAMLDVPEATSTAAALRTLIYWDERSYGANDPTVDASNERLVRLLDADRDAILRLCHLGRTVSGSLYSRTAGASFSAALLAIYRDTGDLDGVIAWAHVLASGAFEMESPELALQRWCLRTLPGYKTGRRKALTIVQATIRSWNARREGRSIEKMWVRDGAWPKAH